MNYLGISLSGMSTLPTSSAKMKTSTAPLAVKVIKTTQSNDVHKGMLHSTNKCSDNKDKEADPLLLLQCVIIFGLQLMII